MRTSRHQYQERHFEDHTPDTGDGLIEYTRITLENALEKELISQLEYERATAEGYTHLRRDAETGEFLGKGKKAIKLY